MLRRVISGGQTGVDLAGLRAAKTTGLLTGGWMPAGFKTEAGPRPEYAEIYGLREHPSPDYPPRTRANVEDSDGVLWIGSEDSRGMACTEKAARLARKPLLMICDGTYPTDVIDWILDKNVAILDVAGNRESSDPGIGARAEAFLLRVFRRIVQGSSANR